MDSTFSSIQSSIFRFLVKQNKLKAQDANIEKIDFSSLYELLKISAPGDGIDLESPEGIEYIKGLVEEFMKLDYIKTMADDNKDGTLSVKEKSDFMNEELEMQLSADKLEKLFGKDIEEIEEIPDVGGGGGGGGDSYVPTTNNNNNNNDNKTQNTDSQVTGDVKVESARQNMLEKEYEYKAALDENFKDNQEVIKLEQDREVKNQDILTKQDEKNTLSDESNQLTGTISSLETKISEKDSAISDLQSQLAALSSSDDEEGNDNSAQISAIEAQISQLEQEKADLEAEKKDAEDRKSEIDDKLIPDLDSEIETIKSEITEIDNQIKEKIANCKVVNDAFTAYLTAKDEYNKVYEEYLEEEKEKAEKAADEDKALRQDPKLGVENDKEYENIDDILYESKIKDNIKKYTENMANVSYSHTSSGNYEVKEKRDDGTVVVTTFDRNGEITSTRSSSLPAITTEQEEKAVEAINAKTNGKTGDIEYTKSSDGTITATVRGENGEVAIYSFNKDGEIISSDDMDEIIQEDATKEAIANIPVSDGENVNYKKDGDNYIITVTGKDGSETSYNYDKDGKLVSSSSIEQVAPDKKESVQSALQGITEDGEQLEYTENEDGTITVVGTYGGIETTYKFDQDGNYIGSSDIMDAAKNINVTYNVEYFANMFAGEDKNLLYRKENDGSITVTTNEGTVKFDENGILLYHESSDISSFSELNEEEKETIENFLNEKGLDGNITYKADYTTGEFIVRAEKDGVISEFGFADKDNKLELIRSENMDDLGIDDELKGNVEKTLSEQNLIPDGASVQYKKLSDGESACITAEITDKDGNIFKYTIDSTGKIVASSDITKIGVSDESVINKISDIVADENNCIFETNEDGNIIATAYTENGNKTIYGFSSNGELIYTYSQEADKAITDKNTKEKIVSQLATLGVTGYSFQQNEDSSISVIIYDKNNNQLIAEFDKDGNMTNADPDLLFKNTASTDYALSILENGLGVDINDAKYSLTPEGNIKIIAQQDGKEYIATFDPKHGNLLFINDKEFAWNKFSTEAQNNAEETLKNMGIDTSSIIYSGDSDTLFSACVYTDGYETTYQFDENGNLVKYTNANGTFEQKHDENGNAYIEYTSPSYSKNSSIVASSDLEDIAKQYTPEILKQITAYRNEINNYAGTDAEKIIGGLGMQIPVSMTSIYNNLESAQKENGVYPNGTIAIINPSVDNNGIVTAQAGVVTGTIQTEDGIKYIILEPSANGDIKVATRDEDKLEFISQNN